MNLSKYEEQIEKTGFGLENYVLRKLKSNGWTTISNKYYIDDDAGIVREIDLISYKARQVNSIWIYTVLIISCKKSESNCWSFLTRSIDKRDPNKNLTPIHAWSNNKSINHQINLKKFSTTYHEQAKEQNIKHLSIPDFEIFAFQEMNKQTGAPQNDKAIFSSITSLMKSQSYEINSLPKRKKNDCAFQFSLINIVDGDFIQINFDSHPPKAEEINSTIHISNYIIQQKDEAARMLFIRKQELDKTIIDYNKLHEFNCSFFAAQYKTFFDEVIKDSTRRDLLKQEFLQLTKHNFFINWLKKTNTIIRIESIDFHWNKNENTLLVYVKTGGATLPLTWTTDTENNKIISEALENIYHYTGSFEIEDFIPF